MCEAKFTKGEWKIFNERVGIVDNSDTQSYRMMMEVAYVDMYNFGDVEGKANAHLIKTSPKIYEALERIVELLAKEELYTLEWLEMHTGSLSEILSEARGEHA